MGLLVECLPSGVSILAAGVDGKTPAVRGAGQTERRRWSSVRWLPRGGWVREQTRWDAPPFRRDVVGDVDIRVKKQLTIAIAGFVKQLGAPKPGGLEQEWSQSANVELKGVFRFAHHEARGQSEGFCVVPSEPTAAVVLSFKRALG